MLAAIVLFIPPDKQAQVGAERPSCSSRGSADNNAVAADVCKQTGGHTSRRAPCVGSPVFCGAFLRFAWAPAARIRRLYRTEAAMIGWRLGVCVGLRVQMF